jgi:hypothetical protein
MAQTAGSKAATKTSIRWCWGASQVSLRSICQSSITGAGIGGRVPARAGDKKQHQTEGRKAHHLGSSSSSNSL